MVIYGMVSGDNKKSAILYRNELNGYTIFTIDVDDTKVVCKGKILTIQDEMYLSLTGNCYIDSQRRTCFVFDSYEIIINANTLKASFLKKLNIKGLTIAKINKILEKLPTNEEFNKISEAKFLNLFENTKGIDNYTLHTLYEVLRNLNEEPEIANEILKYGGTYHILTQIKDNLKKYRENPYLSFIPFKVADGVAKDRNYSFNNEQRVERIVFDIFNNSLQNGNTCLTYDEINRAYEHFKKYGERHIKELPSIQYIFAIIENSPLFTVKELDGENYYYLTYVAEQENNVVEDVIRLTRYATTNVIKVDTPDYLGPSQRIAFEGIFKNSGITSGIYIITGGPGTGKTTLTKALIDNFSKYYDPERIVLCSPTGCAAQNMEKKCQKEAFTIHKTLGICPSSSNQQKLTRSKNLKADVIIVDEASMLDLELTSLLFSAVKTGGILILIGDVNQLPSVRYGRVLKDLIDSHKIPTFYLRETYRQAEGSLIITNANNILEEKDLFTGNDFKIQYFENDTALLNATMEFVKLYKNNMVLTPNRQFLTGSVELSYQIQEQKKLEECSKINTNKVFYDYNERPLFYIGSRIIATSNSYEYGYYNGDMGVITDICPSGIEIVFDKNKNSIERTTFIPTSIVITDIELAYAISIHKSQGSEYNEILIILSDDSKSLCNKNLLYTGVTRAKEKVTIYVTGNEKVNWLQRAIHTEESKRNSILSHLI